MGKAGGGKRLRGERRWSKIGRVGAGAGGGVGVRRGAWLPGATACVSHEPVVCDYARPATWLT